jgi:sugar phosphate isomerase/epimerase
MISTLNSVSAGSNLPFKDFVQLAARHGFKGAEFNAEKAADISSNQGTSALKSLYSAEGVIPAVFGLPVEWRQDEDTFLRGLRQLPEQARVAQELGCERCCTWVLPDGGVPLAEYRENSSRRWAQIAHILEDQGIRFGLEFVGPAHFRTNPDNVWFYDIPGALQEIGNISADRNVGNIGLLVDSFHWYTSGGSMMDLASIPVEQIVHVHINDAPNVPMDQQQDKVRLLPGESGVIDLKGFLQTLSAIGYDGPVAAEVFSDDLKQLPTDEAASLTASATDKVFKEAGIVPVS